VQPVTTGVHGHGAAVSARWVGYRAVIVVTGRLGPAAGSSLVTAFWDAIERGAQEVWLDLSLVTRGERDAPRLLDQLVVAAHELNRRVLVVSSSRPLRAAVTSSMDGRIEVYATVGDAQHGRLPSSLIATPGAR
jgi:hypothetical protein